jgi:hypothetical protein
VKPAVQPSGWKFADSLLDQSGFEPLVPPVNGLPFHTDIISAQHFWTGGLETAGPGRDDAVAIARAAGFRMLVMSRIRHAAIVP